MDILPVQSSSNIYTPSSIDGAGGYFNQENNIKLESNLKLPEEPAVMINLYIELKFDDPEKQKQTEREFLKRLLAFSKSDKNMCISLVKQPRDYEEHEVIKVS